MNYKRLVESGRYKREELSKEDRNFVNGMDYILAEVMEQDFSEVIEIPEDCPGLKMVLGEIAKKVVENVKEQINGAICQVIVECIDSDCSKEMRE